MLGHNFHAWCVRVEAQWCFVRMGCKYFPLPLKHEAKNSANCWEDSLGGFFQSGDEKNYKKKPKIALKRIQFSPITGTYKWEKPVILCRLSSEAGRTNFLVLECIDKAKWGRACKTVLSCKWIVLEPLFCPVFWIWHPNTLSLLFPVPAADRSCLASVYLLHPDLCKTFISALRAAWM